MRIIWDTINNRFGAEISLGEHWRDDVDLLKQAKFHTDGPPEWKWHSVGIIPLEQLRKNPPKSGLAITELALEKYNSVKEQTENKKQLKKKFEQAKKLAAEEINSSNWKEYISEEGIVCKQIEPAVEKFLWKYTPPPKPELFCFRCGDCIYFYEYLDMCLWCDKISKETLDKTPEV